MTQISLDAVTVDAAGPGHRETIASMMQLYVHDFSEFWTGTERGELGEDGRFPAYDLAPYWSDPTHAPMLIRVGGNLAGFALLNARTRCGLPVDRSVAEFFVVRKHRAAGVGARAALALFGRLPGQWEIAVARKNVRALEFWKRTAAASSLARDLNQMDVLTADWNGPILRFEIAGA